MKKMRIPRIWIMRLAAMILAPTLFLLILEGILRLSGYGNPTTFFIPIDGQDKVTGNSRYTYQYFPKQLVREPDLIRMDKDKPDDVYRIFVMGGSAARGTPDPRFGFGRILEVMLGEAYPNRRFEVVNTAMVAINSHVVMRIARECADYDPDLFVVYMGNNEAVGPFGVGTAFNEKSPGRGMVALSMAARSSRTGQLIKNIIDGIGEKNTQQAEWLGMETFNKHQVAANDPRLQKVYEHMEANLKDIAQTAEDAGIPLILCTVPVNLRNCAPLASGHANDLDETRRNEWQQLYDAGIALGNKGQWAEAEKKYAAAQAIDDQYAELYFRRGRCSLALNDVGAARAHFETARDLDLLRFRTDSAINRIIRKTGEAESVTLLDVEKQFNELPHIKHGIPGDEIFYEHVHFRFQGNYELARMVFEETANSLGSTPPNPIPSIDQCAELLALSNRDKIQMASSMMSLVVKPPFLDQLDYYERCEKIHAEIRTLRKYKTDQGLRDAESLLTAALEQRPNSLHARLELAKLQLQLQKPEDAEKTIHTLMELLPERADFYALLGQALLDQGDTDNASDAFDKTIELAAQPLDYMVHIAQQYEAAEEKDRALELFKRAIDEQPGAANRHNLLGEMFLQRGEREKALKEIELADSLLPGNGRILFNLAKIHFDNGDINTAIKKLQETLKANPFHLGARKQLGLILKRLGNLEEAVTQLSKVIRQEPDEVDLRMHHAEACISLRKFDAAETDYRQLLKNNPDEFSPALGLAWVLAVNPDSTPEQRTEAVTLATRVVALTGRRSAKPLDVLAVAWASTGKFDKAQSCAEEALKLAMFGRDQKFTTEVTKRLELFQVKKAYQMPAEDGH